MKTKVLIIAALVVSIAMFSTGAFAWFNSQTVNTGNINSGTLTLNVATGDCATATYGSSATVWSMSNMAPSDTVDGKLCMKNTGTIAAKQVTYEWVYDPALQPLADRIFLVSAYDSTDVGDQIAQFIGMGDGILPGGSPDGKLSLTELAWLSNHYSYPFDAVSGGTPWLPAGGAQWLYLKFQFDENAGNEFQGKSFNYTLKVTAEQRNVFP